MIEKMITISNEKHQINNLNNNSSIIRTVFDVKNTIKIKIKKKLKK